MTRIRKVAVLGAGVMGSGIAAHLAGAGVPVVMLDIVPPDLKESERKSKAARDRFAAGGKEKALAAKPAAFFSPRDAALVEVGNFEDDLPRLADCDWIVEVVTENLAVKQALYARVEAHRRQGSLISSNTSGLPLKKLVEGRSDDFRRNFLVTHFFNPVRYMKLLELVAGPETDPRAVERLQSFGEDVLGKGVVHAKDTPNFIANRIGTYAMMDAVRLMVELDLTIDEVDAVTGRPLGHPKSATFRTGDIVGLDTLLHVAENCRELLAEDDERGVFEPPAFMKEMVKRKLLGDKTKGGFYKKTSEGILTLDWKTFEYRPQQKPRFESIGALKGVSGAGERMKALVGGGDKAAQFAAKALARTLNYSAKRLGEIADDVVNIDRGLRWGFNWELGPFEILDAIGPAEIAARLEADGVKPAALLEDLAASGARLYPTPKSFFDVKARPGAERPIPVSARALDLPREDASRVIRQNDSATVWDLGDGVVGLEFHSKMNTIDGDLISMMDAAVDEAEARGAGLVIGNEAKDAFSAGANLFLVLMAAREKQFDAIEALARGFQRAAVRLRTAEVPVVAAPFGMALAGGAEVVLGAGFVRAHAELYMGLVEVGVGLIPAGGGCREMIMRAMAGVPDNVDPFLPTQKVFETLAMGKVSTSAEQARDLGFLRACDRVTLSREQLLRDAKETALGLSRAGYRRPPPRTARVAGEAGLANFKVALWSMAQGHQVSEHDVKVGTHLARVLCGGSVAAGTRVGEQHLLDLEMEAFLSLCGEEKTQARMEYMLTNNKPLRN
jgi:3-hydroxyacyl-CoA dehydrogenase